MTTTTNRRIATYFLAAVLLSGCDFSGDSEKPRLSMFVGVDISGSFMQSDHYDDAIDFLAHYLYAHLHGLGGLEVPSVLFVSSIGGATADQPKTFYPRQTFENQSVEEIAQKLRSIFPRGIENPFTDYNAFFDQIALTVRNKKLVLRPILDCHGQRWDTGHTKGGKDRLPKYQPQVARKSLPEHYAAVTIYRRRGGKVLADQGSPKESEDLDGGCAGDGLLEGPQDSRPGNTP